ncbi:hypothetical protein K4K52_003952 [Colletotrichum sp. SAR 10_76]|nr:hypothetical protein K4K51_002832 [Colletotrichum sp. SAR 10_75]KAI8205724.1 hypothetical protein K4K52_003952 [Colletotrichum sp. SAR 10_76]
MASDLIDFWDDTQHNTFHFRAGRHPRKNDVFIAVMGVTGSGKSSFIEHCSGKPVQIGHNLRAGTTTVDVYAYDMSPVRTVYLIDTPGFDDTTRSDAEVLGEIATWLGASYKQHILLHGIIYLHRITDRRMQGAARKNIRMFRQLCGNDDALSKVHLVTTMWDQVDESVGLRREKELVATTEFWGAMVSKGSLYYRHYHTSESAKRVVNRLAAHDQPITTDMQRQLVDEGRRLSDTAAGQELENELIRQRERLTGEHAGMEEEMRAAANENDAELMDMLKEELANSAGAIQKVEKEISDLRVTMETMIEQRDAAYRDQLEQIRQQTEMLKVVKEQEEKQPIAAGRSESKSETRSVRTAHSVESAETSLHADESPSNSRTMEEDRTQRSSAPQVKRLPEDSPVSSVSMWGEVICIIGDTAINSSDFPKLKLDSSYLRNISLGDAADGSRSWIAKYEKTWMASDNLSQLYPDLGEGIKLYGLRKLEFCFLGPDSFFVARWNDGHSRCSLPPTFPRIFEGRSHIVDVAFGFRQSFLVVYVAPGQKSTFEYDLKDYYQDLKLFLEQKENKKIDILAITLDPNTTDYILVYTYPTFISTKEYGAGGSMMIP